MLASFPGICDCPVFDSLRNANIYGGGRAGNKTIVRD